jgi:hypothetical protein
MITLERLMAIAENNGMDVVINKSDTRTGYIGAGAEALVRKNIAGQESKWVAFYRTKEGGNAKHPYHCDFEFLRGYAISRYPSSDWKFSLDGQTISSPMQDAYNPWLSLGPSWEREELYAVRNKRLAEEERLRQEETTRLAAAPQQELHVRTRKTSMEAKKRRSSPPRQTISRPLSDLLSAILAQKEGPVIEGRVKVISENRFRTSLDTLLATWVELGGAYDSLEREIRRGEIEIVEARPGFGKRGLYGDKDMKTLEFVVHNDVRL